MYLNAKENARFINKHLFYFFFFAMCIMFEDEKKTKKNLLDWKVANFKPA